MDKLYVERLGGIAGYGGARAHIRSHGAIDLTTLSAADQQAVERLFQSKGKVAHSQARDTFRYRISRPVAEGVETVEVPEENVPEFIRHCVRDEFI